jgi:hypothetical protein
VISAEAKAAIDALSRDDLRMEVEKGHRSRFQGDKYAYAKHRLAQLQEVEERGDVDREHALLEEANRIAHDANERAKFANRIAIASVIVAVIAVIISIVD